MTTKTRTTKTEPVAEPTTEPTGAEAAFVATAPVDFEDRAEGADRVGIFFLNHNFFTPDGKYVGSRRHALPAAPSALKVSRIASLYKKMSRAGGADDFGSLGALYDLLDTILPEETMEELTDDDTIQGETLFEILRQLFNVALGPEEKDEAKALGEG